MTYTLNDAIRVAHEERNQHLEDILEAIDELEGLARDLTIQLLADQYGLSPAVYELLKKIEQYPDIEKAIVKNEFGRLSLTPESVIALLDVC